MYKNIFITGPPGSGKSTLLMDIVKELEKRGIRVRGIICPEIRRGKYRWGFKVIVYPDGQEEILASVEIKHGPRVSKYRVNINGFERVGVRALQDSLEDPKIQVLLIDEIGKMELFSNKFRNIVIKILNSNKIVLGVLGRTSDPIVSRIKSRKDVLIIDLSYDTAHQQKDSIKKRIVSDIVSMLSTPY